MTETLARPADQVTPDTIGVLVRAFYGKARLDPQLGPVFTAAIEDWEAHLAHLTHFWSVVMLGQGRFSGNPMAAHARHPITPEMFDTWLGLWRRTAEEVFAPELAAEFVSRAERIAESLKLGLFFRPAAATTRP